MNDKLYTIKEIVNWYTKNADTRISDDFIIHLIKVGILKSSDVGVYNIDIINSYLLETYNSDFVKDDNNKFKVKNNRKKIILKYPQATAIKPKKFKLTTLSGNKLKLIKLN